MANTIEDVPETTVRVLTCENVLTTEIGPRINYINPETIVFIILLISIVNSNIQDGNVKPPCVLNNSRDGYKDDSSHS